jgi:hypothetical protein
MMVSISTTNYKTNLVVCKRKSLCMRIVEAIHVIISYQCKAMAINSCVKPKSIFFAGDKFFQHDLIMPIGAIYLICILYHCRNLWQGGNQQNTSQQDLCKWVLRLHQPLNFHKIFNVYLLLFTWDLAIVKDM